MNLIPATFLAGALLSLLVPTIMLTALIVWYMLFVRKVPDTAVRDKPGLPDPAILPDEAPPATAAGDDPGPVAG